MEAAAEALSVDVVGYAGTPHLDRLSQDGTDRSMEAGTRRSRERPGGTARTDPGLPERLAGVDVADPRNATLVEQEHLDGRRAASQQTGKTLQRKLVGERFQADLGSPRFFRPDKAHPSERAHVREAKERPVPEFEANVGVGVGFDRPRGADDELPGHPEMNDHGPPRLEGCNDILAAAADPDDALADDLTREAPRLGRYDLVERDRGSGDRLAGEGIGEAARDGLHFGEFGHQRLGRDGGGFGCGRSRSVARLADAFLAVQKSRSVPRRLILALAVLFASCGGPLRSEGRAPLVPQPLFVDVRQQGPSPYWVEFDPPTKGSGAGGIVAGPDGAMWFADTRGAGLVRVAMDGASREYPLAYMSHGTSFAFEPGLLTVGADKNLYFGGRNPRDPAPGLLGVATTTGQFSVLRTPSGDGPNLNGGLGLGPDGNVWVQEQEHVAKVAPSGAIVEYAYPSGYAHNSYSNVVTGPDGDVWFTEHGKELIGKVDTSTGAITEYRAHNCHPFGIAAGPLQRLYAICIGFRAYGEILAITASGRISSQPLHLDLYYAAIVAGPDGALWFTDASITGVNRYDPVAQTLTTYPTASGLKCYPRQLAFGPDGNLWSVDPAGHVCVFILNRLGVSPASLTISVGGQGTLTAMYSGESRLTAMSSNRRTATVSRGSAPDTFVVTGHSAGMAFVTVRDALSNTVPVPVTVR